MRKEERYQQQLALIRGADINKAVCIGVRHKSGREDWGCVDRVEEWNDPECVLSPDRFLKVDANGIKCNWSADLNKAFIEGAIISGRPVRLITGIEHLIAMGNDFIGNGNFFELLALKRNGYVFQRDSNGKILASKNVGFSTTQDLSMFDDYGAITRPGISIRKQREALQSVINKYTTNGELAGLIEALKFAQTISQAKGAISEVPSSLLSEFKEPDAPSAITSSRVNPSVLSNPGRNQQSNDPEPNPAFEQTQTQTRSTVASPASEAHPPAQQPLIQRQPKWRWKDILRLWRDPSIWITGLLGLGIANSLLGFSKKRIEPTEEEFTNITRNAVSVGWEGDNSNYDKQCPLNSSTKSDVCTPTPVKTSDSGTDQNNRRFLSDRFTAVANNLEQGQESFQNFEKASKFLPAANVDLKRQLEKLKRKENDIEKHKFPKDEISELINSFESSHRDFLKDLKGKIELTPGDADIERQIDTKLKEIKNKYKL